MKLTTLHRTAVVAGPLIACTIAVATSSVRDQVGATDVGIALALVVVLAALVGRWPGLATAAVAALGFNYFHTEPYHSLRINSSGDVTIVALLVALGFVVSDISAWRRRRDVINASHVTATDAPGQLRTMLASDHPVTDVWPTVTMSIMDQLRLAECRYTNDVDPTMPLISRVAGRNADGDDGFVLPSSGAAMPVVAGAVTLGHLIVTPRHGVSSLWVERRVVVAMADHLAIAMTYTGHEAATRSASDAGQQAAG